MLSATVATTISYYSKALNYTSLSYTGLADAHFLIVSYKDWDKRIYAVKSLSYMFIDTFAVTLLSNSSCTNFEVHEFFHSPKNVHLKALL